MSAVPQSALLKRSESFTAARTTQSMAGFSPGGQVAEGYSYLSRSSSISTSTRSRPRGLQTAAPQDTLSPRASIPRLPSASSIKTIDSSPTKRASAVPPPLPRLPETLSFAEKDRLSNAVPSRSESEAEVIAADAARLPSNPKHWTPSQVAIYLTHVLGLVPRPVVEDLTSYVRTSRMGGRTFLRLSEKELERQGLNLKWRKLMIEAGRKLRRDALRGRIFGNKVGSIKWPKSAEEFERQEEDEAAGSPVKENGIVKSSKGHSKLTLKRMRDSNRVRGMIEAFQTSPSTQSFNTALLESIHGSGYVKEQASSISSEAESGQEQLSLRRPLRSRRSAADFPWLSSPPSKDGQSRTNDICTSVSPTKDTAMEVDDARHQDHDAYYPSTASSASDCSDMESENSPNDVNEQFDERSRYGVLDEDTILAIMNEEELSGTEADTCVSSDAHHAAEKFSEGAADTADIVQIDENVSLSPLDSFAHPTNEEIVPALTPTLQGYEDAPSSADTFDDFLFEAPCSDSIRSQQTGSVRWRGNKDSTFGSKRGNAMLSMLIQGDETPSSPSQISAAGSMSARRRRSLGHSKGTAEDEEGWGGTLGRSTDRISVQQIFAPAPSYQRKKGGSIGFRKQPLERVASEADGEAYYAGLDRVQAKATSEAQQDALPIEVGTFIDDENNAAIGEQLDADDCSITAGVDAVSIAMSAEDDVGPAERAIVLPEDARLSGAERLATDTLKLPVLVAHSAQELGGQETASEPNARSPGTVVPDLLAETAAAKDDLKLLVPLTVLEPHPSGAGSIKKRSMVLVDRKRFESLARRMNLLEAQLESINTETSKNKEAGVRDLFTLNEAVTAIDTNAEDAVMDKIVEVQDRIMEKQDHGGEKGWRSLISPSGWAQRLCSLNPYYSAPPLEPLSSEDETKMAAFMDVDEAEYEEHMLSVGAIPAYMLGLGAGLGFVLVREVLGKAR